MPSENKNKMKKNEEKKKKKKETEDGIDITYEEEKKKDNDDSRYLIRIRYGCPIMIIRMIIRMMMKIENTSFSEAPEEVNILGA